MNVAQLTRSIALLASLTLITACGGGGGGSGGNRAAQGSNADSGCTGFCATSSPANLTVTNVQQVIAQAALEASNRGAANVTIAVTDRVGNVLAIYRIGGATTFNITSGLVNGGFGLENVNVLDNSLAAISKAVTGSYLASEGNAFSTRTASQIIQEHFNPHEQGTPGGPLFGVQFSQLPCGDLVQKGNAIGLGPRRAPLGLSADPGGLPLYKNGHPVGAIGVIADGVYGIDRNILNTDSNIDELIAIAGQFGFAPSVDRQANRITVDGRSLRYSDVDSGDLATPNPAVATFPPAAGALIDDSTGLYFLLAGGIRAGTTFAAADSGIEDADVVDAALYPGLDAFVLTDGAGNLRHPLANGAMNGGEQLLTTEVTQIIRGALAVANRSRAQIRRPLNSQARVSISIVDIDGTILAIARTRDAPLFGTDVSLQKARTATFFSSNDGETDLDGAGTVTSLNAVNGYNSTISGYSAAARTFIGVAVGDLTGDFAFADRSGGNLSRPFYPDGVDANSNGPFSKSFSTNAAVNQWSPFSNGLQLDLVLDEVVEHLTGGADDETDCTEIAAGNPLRNGIQIFPGSVPIYKNGVLVGGIGVSGDGVDQDDMISFLGLYEASLAAYAANNANGSVDGLGEVGKGFGNAPKAIRADKIPINAGAGFTEALKYIQCPQNPYIGSSDNNVCAGK
ncbi:MAG: heme-binding protein [Sulfuriflexus sp.]|nr:heme-binding protein [Sulfuriflexus sp.]